ncbi:hypothetical protein L873DRAFT_609279 [Choiromyces venosus 120613-1]|uniref:Uncharacterized protein n=1 Tax=Choiromyces venosus 120613-1 TaxID=1336337 RepID=A0A3N4JU29_9PEZI|nr:hypothetical protein L873DRAFT_609279 [Choiromyces venosus 120613-1]
MMPPHHHRRPRTIICNTLLPPFVDLPHGPSQLCGNVVGSEVDRTQPTKPFSKRASPCLSLKRVRSQINLACYRLSEMALARQL